MANKEKKLEHIQVKDNGIKLSNKVGDTLNDAKQLLQKNIFDGLLKGSDETSIVRYKIAQNNALRDYRIISHNIVEKVKKEVKTTLQEDKTVNLKPNQVARMSKEINKGLLFLQQDAYKQYQNTVRDVFLNVKAASDLKEQLAKHIATGLNLGVVYKDDKHYSFDTYFEMKTRTDIQQDIGKNMIAAGKESGVIFYITSFYGDCAPDHVDYQGRIYYDENWESMAPKDRLDEIRDYIKKLDADIVALGKAPNASVQAITESDVRLTTRPNCRHYFQYISIDEVLGAKTEEQVNDLREERGLNSGGKYQPDKYKALQQQRLNERKIRAEKAEIQKQEQLLHLNPGNKEIQSKILTGEANVKKYQADQRNLIWVYDKKKKKKVKRFENLERRYDREKLGNRVSFGVE